MITGTDACTQRIDQMTDQTEDQTPAPEDRAAALSEMAQADAAEIAAIQTERSKPEQDAKSPIRAKRHLRLVPDTEAPETVGNTKAGKGVAKRQRSAPDPITGLTEKQELFCQHVIGNMKDEDGNVMSLSDSYRAAYATDGMTDKTIHEAACRLFADGKVTARLKVLAQEKEDNRRMMAAKDAEIALQVFREMAADKGQPAARVRAAELLGKTAGLFTDKVEFEDKTDRSTADLEQSIAERLARLGIAR